MSFKVRPESSAILTPEDSAVLHAIYRHRCLSEEQLTGYFYFALDDGKNGYTLDRVNALIEAGFMDPREYRPGRWVYYLTYMGVQYVRDTSDRPLYTTREKSGRRRYDATAGTLRLHDFMLDHQCRLNDLVLEIIRRCGLDPDCYKDNLFASNFTYAQPDGVIELPGFDLFLEMDMGNERLGFLRGKWDHYRAYFRSRDYQLHRRKKIIVLFATENVQKLSRRRRTVVKSLVQTSMDLLGPTFECYIGPNEEMVEIAAESIVGASPRFQEAVRLMEDVHGARANQPAQLSGPAWGAYRCIQPSGATPFLFVDGYRQPASILKMTAYFGQTQAALAGGPYRRLRLLILVPGAAEAARDILSAGIRPGPEVCYVTLERLRERPLHEALFLFDQLGGRYCFAGPELAEPRYEMRQFRVQRDIR